jgi:hypothetical protein
MIVILKRLSETTKISDIEHFLESALKGNLFKKAGQIESLTIQEISTPDLNQTEYHAIVNIKPDRVAKRVIKSLNRKLCNGKPINVSEYVLRYKLNDRRSNSPHHGRDNLRKGERRRSNLQVSDITKQGKNANGPDHWAGAYNKLSSNPFDNTFRI